jgi:hypothetical protein
MKPFASKDICIDPHVPGKVVIWSFGDGTAAKATAECHLKPGMVPTWIKLDLPSVAILSTALDAIRPKVATLRNPETMPSAGLVQATLWVTAPDERCRSVVRLEAHCKNGVWYLRSTGEEAVKAWAMAEAAWIKAAWIFKSREEAA